VVAPLLLLVSALCIHALLLAVSRSARNGDCDHGCYVNGTAAEALTAIAAEGAAAA